MKTLLSHALKKEFHEKMSAEFPDFPKSGTAFGGTIYRKYDANARRYIFIFLEPDVKNDRFTLELGTSTVSDFPFHLLPGDKESTGDARYRIRTFLSTKTDGWWNVNTSESTLPNLDAIMKTFERASIEKGLARIPGLVRDAVDQLKAALPEFFAAICS